MTIVLHTLILTTSINTTLKIQFTPKHHNPSETMEIYVKEYINRKQGDNTLDWWRTAKLKEAPISALCKEIDKLKSAKHYTFVSEY